MGQREAEEAPMTLRPDDNSRGADDFVAAINRRHMAGSTLNVRREEKRLRRDPLEPLVRKLLGGRKQFLLRDDITRYVDAYAFYSLTLVRFYRAVSIGRRFRNGPHYV